MACPPLPMSPALVTRHFRNWCRVKDSHPQPSRSERDASAVGLTRRKKVESDWLRVERPNCWLPSLNPQRSTLNFKWRSRQDSHPHRRRSKRRALVIELQERKGTKEGAEGSVVGRANRTLRNFSIRRLPSKWSRRRDLHSRGAIARQFTKLLLSLLSHAGKTMIKRAVSAPFDKLRRLCDSFSRCSLSRPAFLRASTGKPPRRKLRTGRRAMANHRPGHFQDPARQLTSSASGRAIL